MEIIKPKERKSKIGGLLLKSAALIIFCQPFILRATNNISDGRNYFPPQDIPDFDQYLIHKLGADVLRKKTLTEIKNEYINYLKKLGVTEEDAVKQFSKLDEDNLSRRQAENICRVVKSIKIAVKSIC